MPLFIVSGHIGAWAMYLRTMWMNLSRFGRMSDMIWNSFVAAMPYSAPQVTAGLSSAFDVLSMRLMISWW